MKKLFPYQIVGAEWLSKKKVALLADEMGLGKSAQAITAADKIRAHRILVIAPAIALINWQREFQMFSRTERVFEIIRGEKNQNWDERVSIITSFEACSHVKYPGSFDLIIIDEAHFLKSAKTKRTAAILGRHGLVRKGIRIWALTGTPMPNHAGELWPLLFTFGATQLPYDNFIDRFCHVRNTTFGLQITGTKTANMDELKKLLSKVSLRRKKEDVMKDLPKLFYADVLVERGEVSLDETDSFISYAHRPELLKEKLEMEQALIKHILETDGTSIQGMRALEALANSVSTLRRYTALQKLNPIAEIIRDELESKAYDKVVIFAIHKDVIEGLRRKLEDFGVVTLYGGTPHDKRQKNIDAFQNNKRTRVMIANIQAAGTAVTLTASNQVVFAEQSWVPGDNAQAVMRCHRIGQTRPVTVRIFGLSESVDEQISKALKRKTKELTKVLDLPSMTNADDLELTKCKQDYKTTSVQNTDEISLEELLK